MDINNLTSDKSINTEDNKIIKELKSKDNIYNLKDETTVDINNLSNKYLHEFYKKHNVISDNQITSCGFSSQENLINLANNNQKKKHTLTKEQAIIKMQTDRALEKKIQGNIKFKKSFISEASLEFEDAVNILTGINKDLMHFIDANSFQLVLIECLNNLSLCKLKQNLYYESLKNANKVLTISRNNLKALCIKSKALYYLGMFKDSIVYARNAMSIKPIGVIDDLIKASDEKLEYSYKSLGLREDNKYTDLNEIFLNSNNCETINTTPECNNICKSNKRIKDNKSNSDLKIKEVFYKSRKGNLFVKILKIIYLSIIEYIRINKGTIIALFTIYYILNKYKAFKYILNLTY